LIQLIDLCLKEEVVFLIHIGMVEAQA
jgi:hypothetical protein